MVQSSMLIVKLQLFDVFPVVKSHYVWSNPPALSAKRESVSDFAQVYGDIAAFILKDQAWSLAHAVVLGQALGRTLSIQNSRREHDQSIKNGGVCHQIQLDFGQNQWGVLSDRNVR